MEASKLINKLNLIAHPEGGYYNEIYRSAEIIANKDLPDRYSEDHCFSTSIYYLLDKNQFSAFHKLKSDEIWHFYRGSTLLIHVISPSGKYTKYKLGDNPDNGEHFQVIIPNNSWFGAELENKLSYCLIGCSVSPGFEFSDFILGNRNEMLQQFPHHKELITKLTKK